jgi:hypothetical protein
VWRYTPIIALSQLSSRRYLASDKQSEMGGAPIIEIL